MIGNLLQSTILPIFAKIDRFIYNTDDYGFIFIFAALTQILLTLDLLSPGVTDNNGKLEDWQNERSLYHLPSKEIAWSSNITRLLEYINGLYLQLICSYLIKCHSSRLIVCIIEKCQ